MAENIPSPSLLRVIAAAILGIFVGFFLFFIIALGIGMVENVTGTDTGISTNFTQNILSAILLGIIMLLCIGGFLWKVYTTPPTPEEGEELVTDAEQPE
jgi:glycerol uptake facilitator-like aquaporin